MTERHVMAEQGAGGGVDRWYSLDEIAQHLGISRDTVYRWINLRSMPAHKVGRLWKFKVNEVDEWVRSAKQTKEH